jgi:hypothetical protein
MRTCRRPAPAGGLSLLAATTLFVTLLAAIGCSEGGTTPPSTADQQAIRNVANWYGKFRQNNGGKTPTNEAEFLAFIEKDMGKPVDRALLLMSPRDGQEYVVLYGKPIAANPEKNPVVHEKVGSGGKKLVAFEFGSFREVDDAELQTMLGGK